MKSFMELLQDGKIKKVHQDKTRAKSMLAQSIARINDLKSLPLNEENAPFRFEDAYEAVREALQAFMHLEGYNPYSHDATLIFAYERHILTEAEFRRWDMYRQKRNDINYRSEKTTLEETTKAIERAAELVKKLEQKFSDLL